MARKRKLVSSEAYTKLHEAIKSKGDTGMAKVVKRNREDWVALQNLLGKKDPSLKEISEKWEKLEDSNSRLLESIIALASKDAKSSSSSSESSDSSSSSESDSGEESSSSEPITASKKKVSKTPPLKSKPASDSGSSSSSSESDSKTDSKSKLPATSLGGVKSKLDRDPPVKFKPASSSSESSSNSESSSGSDSESSSDSSSSDSSSSSSSESAPPRKKRKTGEDGSSQKKSEFSGQHTEDAQKHKKSDEDSTKDSTPTTIGAGRTPSPQTNGNMSNKPTGRGKEKQPRKSNTPFQRIKADGLEFADDRLKDNSFNARGGRPGDYGERASADLLVTRGDGFRKEKNKKKRGSYRGGEITLESHSIKF